ncbi:MAG: DNA methyltransferase [Cyclobacteriaceae bacterium]
MSKYLKIGEAAEKLNINPQTLRRWDKSGKFESTRHKLNNYRVYEEDRVLILAAELQMDIEYGNCTKTKHNLALVSPYFNTSLGRLFKADSIELLKSIESESVDLVFADPPYNIKKAEWDSFSSQREYVDWSMRWITEAQRILKNTGSLYICGFSEILADIKWCSAPLFKGCKWLIWYYRNKANLGKDWGRSHESILHFRKSKEFKFNIDKVRIPYNEHTLKYPTRPQADSSQYSKGNGKKYTWNPHPMGAKPKDVLEIPTISNGAWERYPHETQKPIELLRKVILSSSDEGETVVDPFGGSGTTYAVAEAYGRKWIGVEKEEKYCQIIAERLSDTTHLERIAAATDSTESQKRRTKLRG